MLRSLLAVALAAALGPVARGDEPFRLETALDTPGWFTFRLRHGNSHVLTCH
ncbi:MAG: hypothetical protein AAF829_02575 [Pseudomonadota bacterium]